jgi:hypothetical protein
MDKPHKQWCHAAHGCQCGILPYSNGPEEDTIGADADRNKWWFNLGRENGLKQGREEERERIVAMIKADPTISNSTTNDLVEDILANG